MIQQTDIMKVSHKTNIGKISRSGKSFRWRHEEGNIDATIFVKKGERPSASFDHHIDNEQVVEVSKISGRILAYADTLSFVSFLSAPVLITSAFAMALFGGGDIMNRGVEGLFFAVFFMAMTVLSLYLKWSIKQKALVWTAVSDLLFLSAIELKERKKAVDEANRLSGKGEELPKRNHRTL